MTSLKTPPSKSVWFVSLSNSTPCNVDTSFFRLCQMLHTEKKNFNRGAWRQGYFSFHSSTTPMKCIDIQPSPLASPQLFYMKIKILKMLGKGQLQWTRLRVYKNWRNFAALVFFNGKSSKLSIVCFKCFFSTRKLHVFDRL